MTDGLGEPGSVFAGSFFGRRKGKALRAAQEERIHTRLPGLLIDVPNGAGTIDPRPLFAFEPDALVLEIGFGGGEHLAAIAEARPSVGFIGVEPFVNGVAKLIGVLDERQIDNVRLWNDDATLLLPALPEASLDRVYLLFPDPWPKRRQRKRRFVSDENLGLLARAMKPGADLRFATDIDDYAGWTLARVMRSPDFRWIAERASDWREPWADWPGTRYEAKARAAGRVSSYLTFRRV